MTFRDFAPVLYRALMMVAQWLKRHGLHKAPGKGEDVRQSTAP
jgi:hypothetical protein